jgi:hypothetical protein
MKTCVHYIHYPIEISLEWEIFQKYVVEKMKLILLLKLFLP